MVIEHVYREHPSEEDRPQVIQSRQDRVLRVSEAFVHDFENFYDRV